MAYSSWMDKFEDFIGRPAITYGESTLTFGQLALVPLLLIAGFLFAGWLG